MTRRIALAALALALVSCQTATPLTQVVLIVDSDLNVPTEINGLRIFARSPLEGDFRLVNGRLAAVGPEALPRTVALTHRGGPLGLIEVRVEGQLDGAIVVAQEAEFAFRPEETLGLRIELRRSCLGITCAGGETCRDSICESRIVGIEDLEPYEGKPNPIAPSTPNEDGGSIADGSADSGESCPSCPVLPSNVADRLPIAGTAFPSLVLSGDTAGPHVYVFDTDYGSIVKVSPDSQVVREPGESMTGDVGFSTLPSVDSLGVSLGVFQVGSLIIEESAVLFARGSRALVILARSDVQVDGTLSVSHNRGYDPSGGAPAGSNSGGESSVSVGGTGANGRGTYGGSGGRFERAPARYPGGHGGSFASLGGGGGYNELASPTGAHNDPDLVPLLGGSGGGAGAPASTSALMTASGGSGGGAVQITAGTSIIMGSTGLIEAEGQGGSAAQGSDGGGGGGGSGGTILLEAPRLRIEGALRAAGGGGGAGRGCGDPSCEGQGGASQSEGGTAAAGGESPPASRAGAGGSGGDASGSPGATGQAEMGQVAGGGGGGGVGRIRLNAEEAPIISGPFFPSLSSGATTLGDLARSAL